MAPPPWGYLSERVAALTERVKALETLDKVAYVRYASVYRNFRETSDFERLLGKMVNEDLKLGEGD